MRFLPIVLSMLLFPLGAAHGAGNEPTHVSVGVRLHGVSIGINMPAYPALVAVPGYPVYYAPHVEANYFFYDGMYWVFYDDNWYVSVWYNGPWDLVSHDYVPVYILRIPVRYYRHPPAYFHGWRSDDPPRWGEHWGRDWEHRHSGWDQWDRHYSPAPAPLPNYQRQYSGDRYPHTSEQQRSIRTENYRYQPREDVTRQHYQQYGQPSQPRQQQYQQPQQQYIQRQQEQPRPQYQQPQPYQAQPRSETPQQYKSQPQYQQRPSYESRQPPQQQHQQDITQPQRGYQQYPQQQQQQQHPSYESQGKDQKDRNAPQGNDKGKKYDDRDQGHGNYKGGPSPNKPAYE